MALLNFDDLMTSLARFMGVVDGKLRAKADKSTIYERGYLDDAGNTLGANAATASRLKTARVIALAGDATGEADFDGSAPVTLLVTVPGLADKADAIDAVTPGQLEARLTALIGTSPASLDTLAEIAEALNNDPDFAATITAKLAEKASAADVYTKAQGDARYLGKGAQAADAALLGGKAPTHYAPASGLSSLETEVDGAFKQLAQAFTDGADKISGNGA